MKHRISAYLFITALLVGFDARVSHAQFTPDKDILRATLKNGLRVVIVRNPLAPVVRRSPSSSAPGAGSSAAGLKRRPGRWPRLAAFPAGSYRRTTIASDSRRRPPISSARLTLDRHMDVP